MDSKLTPFSQGLMDTLAPPRQATLAVELPRPAQPPGSLHAPQVEATESLMVGTMQDLRVDAVEKQRELEEQLAAVEARRAAALARLTDTIIPLREARLSRQRAAIEAALASLDGELANTISSAFARHDFSLRQPSARMEQRVLAEEEFYFREVPLQFEAQCRASVNTMEGERQALQLNNATIHARERAIEERMDRHEHTYRQREVSEREDRAQQYASLDAAFSALFSRVEESARAAGARYPSDLAALAEAHAAECAARASADSAFAGAMQSSLARLRALALEVYGLAEEEEGQEAGDAQGGAAGGSTELFFVCHFLKVPANIGREKPQTVQPPRDWAVQSAQAPLFSRQAPPPTPCCTSKVPQPPPLLTSPTPPHPHMRAR